MTLLTVSKMMSQAVKSLLIRSSLSAAPRYVPPASQKQQVRGRPRMRRGAAVAAGTAGRPHATGASRHWAGNRQPPWSAGRGAMRPAGGRSVGAKARQRPAAGLWAAGNRPPARDCCMSDQGGRRLPHRGHRPPAGLASSVIGGVQVSSAACSGHCCCSGWACGRGKVSARGVNCSQLQAACAEPAQALFPLARGRLSALGFSLVGAVGHQAGAQGAFRAVAAGAAHVAQVPGWPERAASPMRWRSSRQTAASRGEKGRLSGICHGLGSQGP